jgi:hypothetical protein
MVTDGMHIDVAYASITSSLTCAHIVGHLWAGWACMAHFHVHRISAIAFMRHQKVLGLAHINGQRSVDDRMPLNHSHRVVQA